MATQVSQTATDTSNTVRIALCQFPVTREKATNHQTASEYIRNAASQGAKMVVLPEIWNSPYATAAFPEYAEEIPADFRELSTKSPSAALIQALSRELNLWIVAGSIPEVEDGKYYNTSLVFNPEGEIVAKHRKVHLFDIDVPGGITFFESDTLSPGQTLSSFQTPWCNVGLGICYDVRFAEYAMLLVQKHQCKIILYVSDFFCSGFYT